jgi:hypothetical protein
VARHHATAMGPGRSQLPATGIFGHLEQTATLPGPFGLKLITVTGLIKAA